jgi:putative ABC transport system substrate-binding protein
LDEFRKSMRTLGYVDGQNLTIETRYEPADSVRLAELAKQIVRGNPDVIVTVATPATAAAKNATRSIPIVFSGVGDPVAFGLVDSLRRPGGNITGLANIVPDLAGKRLELLKQVVPGLANVGVLLEPNTPVSVLQWEESQRPARELSLRLYPMHINSPDAYESAFAGASAAGVTAIAVSLSPMAGTNAGRIVNLAARHRMPAIYARDTFVEAGGLMSYGSSFTADGRVMARLVERILAGVKPADLPVERPTEFELGVNMKTAKRLGLAIPESLQRRADRLIE